MTTKMVRFTHPTPHDFANYIAICGIDKGVFSKVFAYDGGYAVEFDNGILVCVTQGPMQDTYNL